MLTRSLMKIAARRWDANSAVPTRNWWTSPALAGHVDRMISPETGRGVIGALSVHPGYAAARRAVSVGCGAGRMERDLMRAGLAEAFDLFEISQVRADEARAASAREGLADRVAVRQENCFEVDTAGRYDLVFWNHALHHMFDVDAAVRWSIDALAPGGWLVINDYVGPTRLQWTRAEVDLAREFLRRHADRIAAAPETLRYKNVVTRAIQHWRDPSEAGQSDLIPASVEKRCGAPLRPIGGAMIHLCAPYVTHVEDQDDPIYRDLIDWDLAALEKGFSHFAFGVWRKPGA